MNVLLLVVPGLMFLTAGVCALLGHRRPEVAGRVLSWASALALLLALALAVAVFGGYRVEAVLEDASGRALAGLMLSEVGAVLLLLVCGVGAVVSSFARRYLRADRRAGWLFASTALLTGATATLVTAATLVGLAAAWTTAGVALVLLLATYPGLPAARVGIRRTAAAFALGDLALWAAVVVTLVQWGSVDLRRLGADAVGFATDGGSLALVSCLLVVAALARSAQLPFGRWLPATLAAPTPVSALLHAGVVNAGGILLVRTSPVFGASSLATHLAFAAGSLTLVYGALLMMTKPDIKGALAHSTMAQMGFMIMTCGLGAFAAAAFHLVAHGMYKATLFLGSGSAVRRHVRHLAAPPSSRRPLGAVAIALSVVVPALAVLVSALLLHPEAEAGAGSGALLVFAWLTGVSACLGLLHRRPGRGTAGAGVVLIVVSTLAYVALLTAVTSLLAPSLQGAGTATASPWLLALPVTALLAAGFVRSRPGALHRWLYVLAHSYGHVATGRTPHRRPPAHAVDLGLTSPREVTT